MTEAIKFETVKKVADVSFKIKDLSKISKVDSISPPSVFIGSKLKYPLVNVGILSPLNKDNNAWLYDDAKYWAENNLNIEEVMSLRNGLLNSRFQAKVSDIRLNKKFVEVAKDVAISSKQVDVEIELKNLESIGKNALLSIESGYENWIESQNLLLKFIEEQNEVYKIEPKSFSYKISFYYFLFRVRLFVKSFIKKVIYKFFKN